jgi:hypothetical protein
MSNQNDNEDPHKFDLGDNLTSILTSIFEPLKGDARIIGSTLSIGVIVLLVSVVFLRDDNLILGLGFGVLLLIIPPSFLLYLRHQENRKKTSSSTFQSLQKIQDLVIIAYSGSRTNVIAQAEVIVTGAPKGASGKTNKLGEWIYKYPYYYIQQNQLVNVRIDKEGVGRGEELNFPLSDRTATLSINLISSEKNVSNSTRPESQSVKSGYTQGDSMFSTPPPQSNCNPLLQHDQIDVLVACIVYGGRVSQVANRRAFCSALGIDTRSFNGLNSDADDAFARLTIEFDSQNPVFLLRICDVIVSSLPKTKQTQLDHLIQHIKSCISAN